MMRSNRWATLLVVLVALVIGLWLMWGSSGALMALATAFAVAYFFVALRFRLALLVIGLVLAASPELTFGVAVPVLLQLPGFQINLKDAVYLVCFLVGVLELARRRETPVFMVQVGLFGLAVACSIAFGLVSGSTHVNAVTRDLRYLEPYSLYFAGCGIVSDRRSLEWLMRCLAGAIFVSACFQVVQLFVGEAGAYQTTVVGGQSVPYLSLAFIYYMLPALCIVFASLLNEGIGLGRMALVGAGLAGMVIQLSRQWYLYTGIGLLSVLVMSRGKRTRSVAVVAGSVAALAAAFNAGDRWLSGSFGGSLSSVVAARSEALLAPSQAETLLLRLNTNGRMAEMAQASPLLGLGPGGGAFEQEAVVFNDVGFLNTLVRFGVVGFFSVLFLIFSVATAAIRQIQASRNTRHKTILIGSLSAWVGLTVAYLCWWDAFTLNSAAAALVMIIVDRAVRLKARPSRALGQSTTRGSTFSTLRLTASPRHA